MQALGVENDSMTKVLLQISGWIQWSKNSENRPIGKVMDE